MIKFNVTYETFSEEDLMLGDTDNRGFLDQSVDLRTAISLLGYPSQGYEVNSRWISAFSTQYEFIYPDIENRALHFPENITQSSKARIFRLVNSCEYI